ERRRIAMARGELVHYPGKGAGRVARDVRGHAERAQRTASANQVSREPLDQSHGASHGAIPWCLLGAVLAPPWRFPPARWTRLTARQTSGSRPLVARGRASFASTINTAERHQRVVEQRRAVGGIGGAALEECVEQPRYGLGREIAGDHDNP